MKITRLPDLAFHDLINRLLEASQETNSGKRDEATTNALLVAGVWPESWNDDFMSPDDRAALIARILAEHHAKR